MVDIKNNMIFDLNEISSRLESDPYVLYTELLNIDEPVILQLKNSDEKPAVLLSRYEDVFHFLSLTNEVSCNPKYLSLDSPKSFWDFFFLNIDGKDHIILRKIVSNFLSKDRLLSIEVLLSNYIYKLLDEIDSCDEFDLIEKIAEAIPLAVLGIVLNISSIDSLRKIRQWTLKITPQMDTFLTGTSFSDSPPAPESTKIITDFCLSLIEERKKRLSDDLISHLITECRLNNISDEAMLGNLISILFAAHDSTVNMIGNGLLLLLKHPDQLNALILDPSLLEQSINEVLRYESPVQRTSYRITKADLEIGNVKVPVNTQVILFIGAANRDHRVFYDSNSFNISRKHNPHLSFGYGLHNCIGKSLAQMEARLLFPKIAKHLTRVKLIKNKPIWRNNSMFRGQENLWVKKYKAF